MLEDYLAMCDQEFITAELTGAQRDYDTAKHREAGIQAYFNRKQERTVNLSAQLAQYTRLHSDWKQTEKFVDIVGERIREIDVADKPGALNITVLETAFPVGRPSSPHKARIMAIAVALGLGLGVSLSLLLESMNHRLRSSEEVVAVLGVPVVGVVPTMPKNQSLAARARMTLRDPASPTAEAYRNIRTAVYFCGVNGRARTLLVTSLMAGDGKSTMVSNLAIAMAQSGQRTLVIDADFRRPSQHQIFDVAVEHGIAAALAGQVPAERAIYATGIDELDVLPCGTAPKNPSEMLHSKVFSELLRRLAEQYECIVIDSPPVMPVTDARILGTMCDTTLLVLRANTATRELARHARDGLLSVGANILGSVVNAVSPRDGQYGYFSLYNNYRWRHSHSHVSSGAEKRQRHRVTFVEGDVAYPSD